MKKLVLIIAFILTGLTGTAQVTQEGYFSVKENFIIWTEIYDTVPEVETMFGNQFFEVRTISKKNVREKRPISLIQRIFIEVTGSFSKSYSASIIGSPVRIGDIEIAQNDFPKMMNWDDAGKASMSLGDGWRLPTKDELHILYQYKDQISGFDGVSCCYWSSTMFGEGDMSENYFSVGGSRYDHKFLTRMVRAVRTF